MVVVRGLLVVSEGAGKRLQVLTLEGVPLQVMHFVTPLVGMCADEQRVWVCGQADDDAYQVHELQLRPC